MHSGDLRGWADGKPLGGAKGEGDGGGGGCSISVLSTLYSPSKRTATIYLFIFLNICIKNKYIVKLIKFYDKMASIIFSKTCLAIKLIY